MHSTYNHCVENQKDFSQLSLFASGTGAIINPQWHELPMSRTNFHGPKDVRAIEVRLYLDMIIPFISTVLSTLRLAVHLQKINGSSLTKNKKKKKKNNKKTKQKKTITKNELTIKKKLKIKKKNQKNLKPTGTFSTKY